MLTSPDFNKKQIAFVFFSEGEKLSFNNDNIVVKTKDGKIKFQCTCYRIFIIYIVGHCSLTSVVLQKAKKFNFFIALMTNNYRLYSVIGTEKNGNTMLKRKQYEYFGLDIAKHITINKMRNQQNVLKRVRNKNESIKDAIKKIDEYILKICETETLNEIMAYEGLSSKIYFKNHFNNILWTGRKPRLKHDYINSALDIGYSILFTFIETVLESYGFDTFCGVMHTQFYMRKSLVCDIIEPFRVIVDEQIKKSINLNQFKQEDFILLNNQYKIKWEKSAYYASVLMTPILNYKTDIFNYIQQYYRSFMKGLPISNYPVFKEGV
ncbi:MAG: type V CRISPR-associated endonuclease Cas1 [Candidatus Fimenecus sp.]